MYPFSPNINAADLRYVLLGVQQLAMVIIVAVTALYQLRKKKSDVTKEWKLVIWSLICIWSVGILGQYALSVYDYLSYTRPLIRHSTSGL